MILPVLTVIYHENIQHFNMALKAWKSFPKSEKYAVINRKLEDVLYPDNIIYLENDENCLARAWNIGLKNIFEKHDVAIVSGLDSEAPTRFHIRNMIMLAKSDPTIGIVSANCTNHLRGEVPIEHGDGSFSFFVITRKAFQKIGDFNERYKPAYFEDNDYLERAWEAGYKPIKMLDAKYFHIFQGSMKYGPEAKRKYSEFMNRNLEIFKKEYGKVPDHLPPNIRF